MDPKCASLLRQLPQVDDLLRHPDLAPAVDPLPRLLAAAVVRRVLAATRQTVTAGPPEALPLELDEAALLHHLREALLAAAKPMLRRVINFTGVIIHTNLGRSPLGDACLAALLEVASRYNTLEYDLARGARGSRQDHLEGLLKELTGADGVLVVNNCAAAVLLALNSLAAGKEVIISRGQLVEIGGSFRMPEIMAASGAILREVGTTNKTHLKDFEKAITSETAVLLKVHPSNYRIMGFTHEVTLGGDGGPGAALRPEGGGRPGQRLPGGLKQIRPGKGTHRPGDPESRGRPGAVFRRQAPGRAPGRH